MNYSESHRISDAEVLLILKGMFFELSPIQMPLCVIVIVQNIIIYREYHRDGSNFVPRLFRGIAFSDTLKAQGELVLSIMGVLVYTGCLPVKVLCKSLFFYMITALPGINCSKLFNLVLTITLTYNVVDPFRRINTARMMKLCKVLCFLIILLHVSDAVIAIIFYDYFHIVDQYPGYTVFLWLTAVFDIPGVVVTLSALCVTDSNTGYSRCTEEHLRVIIYGCLVTFLYFIVTPFVVLMCMMIQVKHLRRSHRHNTSVPDTFRHVSGTVFLVSSLFFFCNTAYFFAVFGWWLSHTNIAYEDHNDHYYVRLGRQVGSILYIPTYSVNSINDSEKMTKILKLKGDNTQHCLHRNLRMPSK